MRFSNSLILVSAALCGVCFSPRNSNAQAAPVTPGTVAIDQLTLVPQRVSPDRPGAQSTTPAAPRAALSLDAPATEPTQEQQAAEDPIYACACGCGVFDVGTASMLPHGQGGMIWLEYDYQDQNRDRRASHPAPSAANADTDIRTDFFNLGVEYFFDRKWGIEAELPVDHRHWVSAPDLADWTAVGDARIHGLYTGFFDDQSLGIDFGLKVPTGNWTHPGPDRDTEIGSGSLDLLFGAYYRQNISPDRNWTFFSQFEWDIPVYHQQEYRPGIEVDAAAGIYYTGFTFHGVTIVPLGQVIGSYRTSDGGVLSAQPIGSGYERVLLSPGIELDFHPWSFYADAEIPVYQYFRGYQLAAPVLYKLILSYRF